MAEQRVDSFFNVQKITGEAAEIKKSIDAIAESMAKALDGAKMSSFTGKGSGGGNTKEFDAMKKAMDDLQKKNEQLQAANDKAAAARLRHEEILAETIRKNAAKEELEKQKYYDAQLRRDKSETQREEARAAREAQNAAKKIGYMNSLRDAVTKLEVEFNSLKTKEEVYGTEGRELVSTLKSKREELANLESMYGKNTMRVGDYSRATNGLRLSMGMLVGEMPNAALGMRTFLMSISNNVQGFSQAISAAKADYKKSMDQFNEGLIKEKPDSVLKQMGSALISFNVIVMIATTLIMMFQDKIAAWVDDLVSGWKEVNRTSESVKGLIATLKDYNGQAASKIQTVKQLGIEINKYGKNTDVAKTIVDNFNSTFNTHLKTIDQVKAAYPDMAKAAIDAAIKMQTALKFIEKGSTAYMKKTEATENLKGFKKDDIKTVQGNMNTLFDYAKKRGYNLDKLTTELESGEVPSLLSTWSKWYTSIQSNDYLVLRNQFNLGKDAKKNREIAKNLATQIKSGKQEATWSNLAYDYMPKPEKKDDKQPGSGGSPSQKTLSEINVKEEFYDTERIKLIKELAALEDDTTKSNLQGELNSYDLRTKAMQKYYELTMGLALSDKETARQTAEEKLLYELKANAEKYNDNVRKFGNGKGQLIDTSIDSKKTAAQNAATLSSRSASTSEANKGINENIDISAGQLKTGNQTLEHNNTLAIAEINDKFNETMLTANKKYSQTNLAIKQDMYNDELYYMEQAHSDRKRILDIELEEQNAAIERGTILTNLLGKLGIKTNTSFDKIGAKYDNLAKQRQSDKDYYTGMRDSKNSTGEQKKEAQNKLNELAISSANDKDDKKRETETAQLQIIEDAKASIIENSIDTLKSLWDSYYEYLEEKIEKQQKLETKRNDERLAQFEDETDAGLHTAKELDDFKKRSAAYQDSIDEESARKKEELEKKKFLMEQAFALGQVWINYAINASKEGVNPVTQAWLLGSAIAQTALIAAQTIPAFAEGGVMEKDGKALMGDGGKHELAWNPRTGEAFITADVPTLYNLDAGTRIFPDVNKLDINSTLSKGKISMNYGSTDPQMIGVLKSIDNRLKSQKQPSLSGVSLMRQMQQSDRYSRRKRGLMN